MEKYFVPLKNVADPVELQVEVCYGPRVRVSSAEGSTAHPGGACAGALYILGSALMFATLGALIRQASTCLPNEMIVFFRNLFALLFVVPLFLARHSPDQLRTTVPGLHLLRSAAGLGAMYCYFYALAHMKLAEAVLLSYTSPLIIPLVASLWIHEKVSHRVGSAVVIGFVGVVFILKPGAGLFQAAALVALGAAAMASVAMVTIRRMSATEPPVRIVFFYTLLATLISGLPLMWAWQTPGRGTWGLLLLIGVVAMAGQFLMTKGYSLAPASQVGPFIYATVVFAALIGWVVWGESLDMFTGIGATLVCLAGIVATTSFGRPSRGGSVQGTA